MQQASWSRVERRRHADSDAAFTFWYQRPDSPTSAPAWMVTRAGPEAAFLADIEHAPRMGERIALRTTPASGHRAHVVAQASAALPAFGQVTHLAPVSGHTLRVGIRFEQPR